MNQRRLSPTAFPLIGSHLRSKLKFNLPSLMAVAGLAMTGLSVRAQVPPWHFEFESGRPVKLVWQTEPGQRYQLRESTDLLAWAPAEGFPKVATGTSMTYSLAPGIRGFFQISRLAEGGGWQLAQLPGLPAGSFFDFSAVSALNATQLWVCGGIKPSNDAGVLRTTDGGLTWTLAYRAAGGGFLGDMQMATSTLGYAAGGGVRRTTDGGTSWQSDQGNLPNPPGTWHNVGPDGYVYGLAVVDAEQVWTAGYDGASAGVIYHRVPGRPQPDPANPNPNTPWWLEWAVTQRAMYGISAASPTTAWAVGYAGYIWKTTDGRSWAQQFSNTTVALQDVAAVDATTAWAVGDNGTILKTTDGGSTWMPQPAGTTENLRRIAAVTSSVAWAVGNAGVILHTGDGGASWTRQFSGTSAALTGVAAVDSNTAWVVGEGNTLLRTTDGGSGQWPAPTITGVSPEVIGESGLTEATLTITGIGFRGGAVTVAVGVSPSASVTWLDESTLLASAPYQPPGVYDVTVTNEDGQWATLPRAVTVLPAPVVTSFRPLHAPVTGGYQLTVDGFNLQSVTHAVLHSDEGIEETLAVSVLDSTRMLVTVPTSATRQPGRVSVILQTAENQAATVDGMQLDPLGGPALAVTSITPASGPAGTGIIVTGGGFTPSTTLQVCGRPLTITSRSATQLVAVVAGSAGLGEVFLSNDETEFIYAYPAFLLTAGEVPTLTQVSPVAGPAVGGTAVTLTGTGFEATDTVTFGGYPAQITARSATSLTVTAPPHPPGVVGVIVMTADLARAAAVLPAAFTYQ
ncbi:MAG: IPT/TIG domain-containing protein [Akkermansiaceae bacterium]|jgi:photosystem II stability/assembly factor-like uncharacterized protein|nr:IPT/TIG domain-containing protein [Akkermansiaceae bacterium]